MSAWSLILVVLQMGAIVLVASPLSDFVAPANLLARIGIGFAALAVLLALWAVASMRRGTLSPFPEPRAGGELVQFGPYRFIRHPMYSAVLLFGLAAALVHQTPWHAGVLVILLLVLLVKIRREESLLCNHYEGYTTYASRTRRLIPGLW